MTQFSLRPGISHHSFGDGAIILDLHRDRYWRVGGSEAVALDWICGNAASAPHPDAIERLCELGLIHRSPNHIQSEKATLPQGRSSAIERPGGSENARLRDLPEVAALLVVARLIVRRKGVCGVVDAVTNARAAAKSVASLDLELVAQRFHSTRSLIPFAAKCLPDTLAFIHYVARRGYVPNLVFGVVPTPFAAHCWAQDGDRILNDAVGHTRAFAPILVL